MTHAMRSFVYSALLAASAAAGCSSQKTFEKNPPFSVTDPTVRVVAAGQESGGTTTELSCRWTAADPGAIELDSLFFRGRVLKPELADSETGKVLKASYRNQPLQRPDLVMHKDSLREVGNQPPGPLPDQASFPFKLERDQAVLSYRLKGEANKRFYRITGIVEKPARTFPGRPQ